MFERFTERARQVVVLAQDEARRLRHNYIGTEHLLLGLLREERGLGARVLESLDVTVDEVRSQVANIVGEGTDHTTGQIPFTPRSKKVLELSLREALSLGQTYIGTEHLLLALVREHEGVGARILRDCDADADKIRDTTFKLLGSQPPADYEALTEREVETSWTDSLRQVRPQLLWWSLAAGLLLIVGALIFGAGLAIGWLIWG